MKDWYHKFIIIFLAGVLILMVVQIGITIYSKIPVNVTDIIPYGKDFDFQLIDNPSRVYKRGDDILIKFHIHKYKNYPETTYRTLVCHYNNMEFLQVLDTVHKNIPLGDTEAVLNNLKVPNTAQEGICYVEYSIVHKLENGRMDNDIAKTEEFTIVE